MFSQTKQTDELIVPSSASSNRTSPYVSHRCGLYIEFYKLGLLDSSHKRIAVLAQFQWDFPLQDPVFVHAIIMRGLFLFSSNQQIGLNGAPAGSLLPFVQLRALGEIVLEDDFVDPHDELVALDEPPHLRLELIFRLCTHVHGDGFERERPRGGDFVFEKVAIVKHIANLGGTRHALLFDREPRLFGGSSLCEIQQCVLSHHADGHLQQQTADDHSGAAFPALHVIGCSKETTLQ